MLVILGTACADSLWTAAAKPLTSDPRARQIGDIITIVVVEASSASQQAATGTSKKVQNSNAAGAGPLVKVLPSLSMSGSQSSSATGSSTNSMAFTTTLTARVTKVLPNGNLELEASRFVQTNNDKQTIKFSGTARAEDIGPDNTVPSTALADLKITSNGKGPVGNTQKDGLFSKLFKLIF